MLRANFEQLFYICLFVKPLTCDQPFVIIIIIFIIIIYFWEEREKESLPAHEGNNCKDIGRVISGYQTTWLALSTRFLRNGRHFYQSYEKGER